MKEHTNQVETLVQFCRRIWLFRSTSFTRSTPNLRHLHLHHYICFIVVVLVTSNSDDVQCRSNLGDWYLSQIACYKGSIEVLNIFISQRLNWKTLVQIYCNVKLVVHTITVWPLTETEESVHGASSQKTQVPPPCTQIQRMELEL